MTIWTLSCCRELLVTSILACFAANATVAQERNARPPTATQADDLAMNNPGSIAEQLRRDDARKDYLFQIPGLDRALTPWYDFKARLAEHHGLKFQLSFANLSQWASDTAPFATEDFASGYELILDGTWTFRGRNTTSPGMIGFEFLTRNSMGTDIPPVALFTQFGSLYPSTVAFGELDPVVGQLYFQQIFNNQFGFRAGKLFPVSTYDFFPLKNFRTDFLDPIHAANLAMPLPERGLGGFVMYRPASEIYFRLGVHDANADAERAGFDSLFGTGELFKIFEVGFDPGFEARHPGLPPFGDVHLTIWHQDKRDEANIEEGWGFVVSGSQRFGRFLPFLRYGYSEGGSGGPALIKHMINSGFAVDNIFGQDNDRIGLGFTWSQPADQSLRDQKTIDMFYRIQVTPEMAVSPTLQAIFDPARNPAEKAIYVTGIRTRLEF